MLKDLREDMTTQIAALSLKLDDRVTVAVFRAMRSDLDQALARLDTLEDASERGKGAWWMLAKVVAVLYALACTGLSVVYLLSQVHGG